MLISNDLVSISYFVLAGDTETVTVTDNTDTNDYQWVLYILPAKYLDSFGSNTNTNLNSSLLTYLLENASIRIGLQHIPSDGKYVLPLKKTSAAYRNSFNLYVDQYISNEYAPPGYESPVEGDFLVLRKNTEELLTPFTGVGTKIPINNTSKTIAGLLAVCSSPCNTNGILVGNVAAAKQLLGDGLERTRAVLFQHLNVIPGPSSCPIDMCVPIIYSEYEDTPDMLDIIDNQIVHSLSSKKDLMLTSTVTACCCLYSILELDHGYRGLDVLDDYNHPDKWSISTSTSSTKVPYRYPLLVHLLSKIHNKTTLESKPLESIENLVTTWGNDNLFSQISNLKVDSGYKLYLFTKLPVICKRFFIQLYRLTCKGIIEMPPSSIYPRRSEASKLFHNTHTKYQSSRTLKDYLELGDLIVQSSLLQQRNSLTRVCEVSSMSPYEVVSNESNLPPVEVKGYIDTFTLPKLWKWEDYDKRLNLWGDISVKAESGHVTTVKSILETAILNLLDNIKNLCDSDKVYTIVDTDSVTRMTNYYGFSSDDGLSISKVSDKLVSRIVFRCEPLEHVNLKTIVDYHINLRHPATYKLITLVIQILSVELMTIYSSKENSRENIGIRHARNSANLAVKQYLQSVLDRGGV